MHHYICFIESYENPKLIKNIFNNTFSWKYIADLLLVFNPIGLTKFENQILNISTYDFVEIHTNHEQLKPYKVKPFVCFINDISWFYGFGSWYI